MRRQRSLKSTTCTERVIVDAAGISAKVKASYPGRSADLPGPLEGHVLPSAETRRDGSAEVSRGHSRPLDPVEGPNTMNQTGA